jgi:hypothetical protein
LRHDVGFLLVVARVQNGEDLGLGRTFIAGVERRERIGIGKVVLLPTALA